MKCEGCGAEITAGSKYCANCGKEVAFFADSSGRTGVSPQECIGVGLRFVALLIDGVILLPVMYFIALLQGTTASAGFTLEGAGFYWGMFIGFAYCILLEGKFGATIGKKAVGLKVVKKDGSPCDYTAATIRTVARIIDGLPFAYIVGAVSVWLSDYRQRIGDRLAGTVIIKAKSR